MSTMGTGWASWLSSSWSKATRMVASGGWGEESSATAVSPKLGAHPPQRRRAAISETQKRVGLLSNSSSESQATCAGCRRAQTESSVVLPKPAGAASRVSGVKSAPSSATSKRSRSTNACGRRGGASLLESSNGCPAADRIAEADGEGGMDARARAWAVSSKRANVTCADDPRYRLWVRLWLV